MRQGRRHNDKKKMIGWYASLDKETIQDLIRQKREHKILEYAPYNEHPTWKEDIKDKWWSTSYEEAKRNIQSHLPLLQLRERLLSIGGL